MIRKFNLILKKPNLENNEDQGLMFYIQQIKNICSKEIRETSKKNEFGLRVEDGRKLVIKSFIQDLSKVSHTVREVDYLAESDLIGIDNEDDKFMARSN